MENKNMAIILVFCASLMAKLVQGSGSCYDGYFSTETGLCLSCPDHCLFCDSDTRCLSCANGFWGTICEQHCSNCQLGTSCEKTNGFCLEKCKEGYTGILCKYVCDTKCLSCDRANGSLCETCSQGIYGPRCDKLCSRFCYNNTCSDAGFCTLGCENGYWGQMCENSCPSHCKDISCDRQDGTCLYGCSDTSTNTRCNITSNGISRTDQSADTNDVTRENFEGIWKGGNADAGSNDSYSTQDNANGQAESWDNIKFYIIIPIVCIVSFLVVTVSAYVIHRKRNTRQKTTAILNKDEESPLTCETQATKTSSMVLSNLPASFNEKSDNELPASTQLLNTCNGLPASQQLPDNELPASKQLRANDVEMRRDKEKEKLSVSVTLEGVCTPYLQDGPPDYWKSKYVCDSSGKRAYIVCKDPVSKLKENSPALWKMVWQENCSIIVNLSTDIAEKYENKYWPEEKESRLYDIIDVTQTGYLCCDDFTQRAFELKRLLVRRQVIQLQFKHWTRNGLPTNEKGLLDFRQKVQECWTGQYGPLLVHCSDGITRSRTFIALDFILTELERQEYGDIGIDRYLKQCQTAGLISTDEQCKYVKRTIGIWETHRDEYTASNLNTKTT